MCNILLASNSPILVTALTEMLSKVKDNDSKVQSVRSIKEVEDVLDTGKIQMLIFDFNIITSANYFSLANLAKRYKGLKTLAICTAIDAKVYTEMYRNGISGIIKMNSSIAEINKALTRVYEGELYMENHMLLSLLTTGTIKNNRVAIAPFENLTLRERLVAELLVEGKANVEICSLLELQPSTVSTFKRNIFTKLNVSTLLELEVLSRQL